MNETQRQAYLNAMGVDVYYPRLQLVGARLSQQCEMPVVAVAPSPAAPVPARADPKARKSPINVSELLDTPARQKPVAAQDLLPANSGQVNAGEQALPVFSLSVTVIKGSLLLVDDCPVELHKQREYKQLLHNIVFALGLGKQAIECQSFQWPEAMRGHHARDAAAAREALQSYLARQLEISEARYLLLMGEAPGLFAVNTELTEAVLMPHEHAPVQLLPTLSASRMLREPELKRQLWQQLQPLYRVLQPR